MNEASTLQPTESSLLRARFMSDIEQLAAARERIRSLTHDLGAEQSAEARLTAELKRARRELLNIYLAENKLALCNHTTGHRTPSDSKDRTEGLHALGIYKRDEVVLVFDRQICRSGSEYSGDSYYLNESLEALCPDHTPKVVNASYTADCEDVRGYARMNGGNCPPLFRSEVTVTPEGVYMALVNNEIISDEVVSRYQNHFEPISAVYKLFNIPEIPKQNR